MEEKILNLLNRPNYTPLNAAELRAQLGLRQQPATRTGARAGAAGAQRANRPHQAGQPLRAAARRRPGAGPHPHEPGGGGLPAGGRSEGPDHPDFAGCHLDRDARRPCAGAARCSPAHSAAERAAEEPTGRVVRVLERARTQLVGTLQRGKQFLYVIPDDPRITQDIYVPPPRDTGRPAQVGDKVVVELREWKSRHANPEGEIIEVLGPPDAEGVDMLSVIRQYKLRAALPEARAARGAVGWAGSQAGGKGRARGLPQPPGRHHRSR